MQCNTTEQNNEALRLKLQLNAATHMNVAQDININKLATSEIMKVNILSSSK